jgi:hypothetical protein
MADDRYTKRVSRAALALATNDRALPYVPGDNERLFAHYYAALGHLHAGDLNGGAVEARRLAWRLQQADERRDPLDRSARAALRYFTGAVFEASGDREDAEVAYRNAAALGALVDGGVAARAEADSAMRGTRRGAPRRRPAPGAPGAAAAPGAGSGDVVVLVEAGFVAHRVNERLSVRLDDAAAERLTLTSGGVVVAGRGAGASGAWDPAPGTVGARLAALLTGDQALWAGEAPPALALDPAPADTVGVPARGVADVAGVPARHAHGPATPAAAAARGDRDAGDRDAGDRDVGDGGGRWGRTFTVAWPAYRRPAAWGRTLGVVVGPVAPPAAPPAAAWTGVPAGAPAAVARGDLSLAAAGDFKRDRGRVLARLVTRAAVRAAVAREAGRKHRGLDDVVRLVSNAAEQADTRSWHLLPGELHVARVRLPAGAHALAADVGGRRVALGTVRVVPGGVRFVSARLWDAAGGRVTAFGAEPAAPPPGAAAVAAAPPGGR